MVNIHGYEGELPPTEGIVVSKIEGGLNNALRELGKELRTEDSVKRQKYIYAAIDHFVGLESTPLTYSWYRWGVRHLVVDSPQSNSQRLFTETAEAQELLDIPYSEYKQFFMNDVPGIPLREWWDVDDHLPFLKQFYTEYLSQDSEYRDVYLANVALLNELNGVLPDLDNTENTVTPEMYSDLCSKTTALEDSILVAESLESEYEYVTETTDLIEDVVMVLAKDDSDVIKQGHATAFEALRSFYQNHVWMLVANQISMNTAMGPHREYIENASSNGYQELESTFDKEYNNVEKMCNAMHLLPNVGDYGEFESESSELDEKMGKLMGVVDGTATSD